MKKWNKRAVPMLLSMIMALALLPVTAHAAEVDSKENPELAAAAERLAAAQENYDYWVGCKESVDQGVEEAKAEIAYWEEQVKASEAERKAAQEQMRVYAAEKRKLQQKVRALNSSVSSLTRELNKKQLSQQEMERYEVLTAQLAELERMIAENPDAVEEIAALSSEVKANSAELSKLMGKKVAADAITQQLADCQTQLAQAQAELDAVVEAESALRTAATDKANEVKQGLASAKGKLKELGNYKTIQQNVWNAKLELIAAQAAYDALQ